MQNRMVLKAAIAGILAITLWGRQSEVVRADDATTVSADVVTSGTWQIGEDVTATLSDNVLTISGTGDTYDYDCDSDYNTESPIYDTICRRSAGSVSVIIEAGVTSIGDRLFMECSGISSVVIGADVTDIGAFAFYRCGQLTEIEVPAKVAAIDSKVFSGCVALESISVNEKNSVYDSRNDCNAIIETDTNTLKVGCKETVIPDSVERLGMFAFMGCRTLTSIDIPSSVKHIEPDAFGECTGLLEVNMAEGLQTVEAGVFYGCTALEKLVFPGSVTTIKTGVLFDGCSSLTEVVLPDCITEISSWTFRNCSKLQKVNLPEGITNIGSYAFYNCKSLASVKLPDSLEEIGIFAFYRCQSLTELHIPKNVKYIRTCPYHLNSPFWGCSALEKITVDSENITYDSRNNCNAIIVKAKDTLLTGSNNTVIPEDVVAIQAHAFSGCAGLTKLEISKNITEIGKGAFEQCTGLEEIVVDERNTVYDSRNNCNAMIETATGILIMGCSTSTIPEGVTAIGDSAFYCCTGLAELELPEGVTSIGDSAFYQCYNLKNMELPESVIDIGEYAFAGCGLTEINIPKGVSSIGLRAFYNCSQAKKVTNNSACTLNLSDVSSLSSKYKWYLADTKEIVTSIANGKTAVYKRVVPDAPTSSTFEMRAGEPGYISCDVVGMYVTDMIENVMYDGLAAYWFFGETPSYDGENIIKLFSKDGTEKGWYSLVEIGDKVIFYMYDSSKDTLDVIYTYEVGRLSVEGSVSTSAVYRGDKVTITATATGGSDGYTYSYLVYNKTTNTWSRLKNFASENTLSWTAGSAGERIFYVEAKDSDGTVVRSGAMNVTVTNPPLKISGKTSSDTVEKGSKLTINGTASGGSGEYTYSYLVYNESTATWARLTSEFVESKTFTWTAGSTGIRRFYVEVRDSEGTVVRSSAMEVEVVNPPLAITGKVSLAEVIKGQKITIIGNASGGSGGYTYSYLVYNVDTCTWARLTSSFVTAKTFSWTAGSAGTRKFYVEVKDSEGTVVRSEAVTVKVSNPPLAVTGKVSASSVVKGNKVVITTNASGGSGEYTYYYQLYNVDTRRWSNLTSSFVTSKNLTWTAESAGNYEVYVYVRDSKGEMVNTGAISVVVVNPALTITGVASVTTVATGNKVTITGTAGGGAGGYTYSYLVYNRTTGAWARLTSSFTSSNILTWTAGSAGTRDFYVEVKDSEGTVVRSKVVTVKVTEPELAITAKASSSSVTAGSKVTITGTATGGEGEYTYSYLVHNRATGAWARLTSSFVSGKTFTWTAGSAGTRDFYVEVKDRTGKVVRSSAITVVVK